MGHKDQLDLKVHQVLRVVHKEEQDLLVHKAHKVIKAERVRLVFKDRLDHKVLLDLKVFKEFRGHQMVLKVFKDQSAHKVILDHKDTKDFKVHMVFRVPKVQLDLLVFLPEMILSLL